MRWPFRLREQRTLWIAFLAVLLPLLVLLVLQYTWLARLARVTAVAHHAALRHYVETVGTEIEYFFRSRSERCLGLPSTLFGDDVERNVARHWAHKDLTGVSRLFLVDYSRAPFGTFRVWNADRRELESPPASDESLAMIVACSPWQIRSYQGSAVEPLGIITDERNPDYRFVLGPVTDDASRVIGVAGMILDETFFRTELLPGVIEETLSRVFPDASRDYFVVTVRDGKGRTAFTTGGTPEPAGSPSAADDAPAGAADRNAVVASLPFVFADWSVELRGLDRSPEELARASFGFNMTLAVLLALVLVGGIAFALQAANRAVHLSELKSDFVSNVSHELRTPLASIRVFAEFLKRGQADSPETVRRYGEHIEAEGRRLSRLIDNILDFSKIESGHKEYRFAPARLEEVIEAAVETFRVRTRDRGFRIELESPSPPLPPIEIDADAIGQVLHNLLDNAVKYSGESRRVAVRLQQNGGDAVCSVRDWGVGIAPVEQEKIFERFHRVGTGFVHDVKGSGLGLAIVQHVVRAHGGELNVESEPGEGTIIRFRLPFARNGESESWPES